MPLNTKLVPSLALILVVGIAFLGLVACSGKKIMTETPVPNSPLTTLPASSSAAKVEVWVTLANQSKKLSPELSLDFQDGAGTEAYVIQVDEATLYQQIEGIGAAMTDSSAWLIMNVLDEEQRKKVMSNLFTRQGEGIGLSYLRIPMGASDFALQDYTYNDVPPGQADPDLAKFSIAHDEAYIIPALQMSRELNPRLRLMGSPWSAPAWMKRNGVLHGNPLLPEYYQAFAQYHVKFIQAYQAHGLPIDAITPQNEPMYSTDSYPTMAMSAEVQQQFIRDYLGPAFKQVGIDTRILILDHNWDLWDYALKVLADPVAAAYVDGVAFHCYGGDVTNQSFVHDAFPDQGIWFTECSGGGWATNFGTNVSWNLHNLVVGNFRNWGKSLILWNLALDEKDGPQNGGCSDCRGVITIDQNTREVTYNEEYYTLGHVSKFVDPGAYRIDSTRYAENQPENVAFLNPDGSLVLIVHSYVGTTFDVEWDDRHFSYHLPAYGTVTFKWNANVKPGPTVTPVATSTPRPTRGPSTGVPPAS